MQGINRDEIVRLTEEYGGAWGIHHTRRLLHLIDIIGADQHYDAEVVWVAAHLHDWGAYSPWARVNVDHVVRSKQVAEAFLAERGCPELSTQQILECIEHHHSGASKCRIEAMLLSDADALDFLGVVGMLRDFAKQPKDLRKAYETTKGRKAKLPGLLCLPRSHEIAAGRVSEMEIMLTAFEAETFGCF